MDPAPLEHRRWTSWTFFAYWISDLITPGGWATSSSFVEMGLTWWESCLAMYVGGFLVAIVITGEFQKTSFLVWFQQRRSLTKHANLANGIIGAKVNPPALCYPPFHY